MSDPAPVPEIVPAIVLAAGASRRLGQPKQLVRFDGETLLARVLRLLRESSAGPAFVVLGAHREQIAAQVDLSQAIPVLNPDWEQGIATSIHAGLHAIQQALPHTAAAMILVCDQPRLTQSQLRALMQAHRSAGGSAITASRYAGIAGIPAIFPATQFAPLLSLQGDAGARHLLKHPACPIILIDFDGGEQDIDLPADLP